MLQMPLSQVVSTTFSCGLEATIVLDFNHDVDANKGDHACADAKASTTMIAVLIALFVLTIPAQFPLLNTNHV